MVILINPFVVRQDREAEFLELWDQTAAIFRASPGYVSARLCRASPRQAKGHAAAFTHVNIAEWETGELYGAAVRQPSLMGFLPRYEEVSTFNPALYEIIRSL